MPALIIIWKRFDVATKSFTSRCWQRNVGNRNLRASEVSYDGSRPSQTHSPDRQLASARVQLDDESRRSAQRIGSPRLGLPGEEPEREPEGAESRIHRCTGCLGLVEESHRPSGE